MVQAVDKFVTLINPQGKRVAVWDFADGQHVENLLAVGWKRPEEKKPAAKSAITEKET